MRVANLRKVTCLSLTDALILRTESPPKGMPVVVRGVSVGFAVMINDSPGSTPILMIIYGGTKTNFAVSTWK